MARGEGDAPAHEREPYFFVLARRAVADPTLARLDELLEEFRGTGHYFAGYARDQEGVSQHLERPYAAVEVLRKELTYTDGQGDAEVSMAATRRTAPVSLILVALAGGLSEACTNSTGRDGDGSVAVLSFTTSVTVAPSHPGTTDPRFALELRAYYDRTGGTRVAIGNQRVALASAVSPSQQVSLPMDLTPCLRDQQRTPAGAGCPVRLLLVLWLENNDVKLDYQVLGPFTLTPGEAKTLPAAVPVAEIVGLDVVPPAPTVVIGGSVTLTARFFTVAGDTVSRPVQWSTDNPGIAKVDALGVVTGVSVGRASITAHWGEGQASFSEHVVVTGPPTSP